MNQSLKPIRRWFFIPAIVLAIIGVPLMLVRPTADGVVFGGLMTTLAVLLASIGGATPRQPFRSVRTSS